MKIQLNKLKVIIAVASLAALSSSGIYAHDTPLTCDNAVRRHHHTVVAFGLNDPSCDRQNIQKAFDLAQPGDKIVLKGVFQYDGGQQPRLRVSNVTVTGILGHHKHGKDPIFLTKLKGVLDTAGLPKRGASIVDLFNRPMAISADPQTGLIENVIIKDLEIQGFLRSVAADGLDSFSNMCSQINPTGRLKNIKITNTNTLNDERGPQSFGAVEQLLLSKNLVSSGGAGIIVSGGGAGCFLQPLDAPSPNNIYSTVQSPTNSYRGLTAPLHIGTRMLNGVEVCNNALSNNPDRAPGTPVSPTVLKDGTKVCPVCDEDMEALYWGPQLPGNTSLLSTFINPNTGAPVERDLNNACNASDSVATGFADGVKIVDNRLTYDKRIEAVTGGSGIGIEIEDNNKNVLIKRNDIHGGWLACLYMAQIDPTNFLITENFFHGCGADETIVDANIRLGAITVGAGQLGDTTLAQGVTIKKNRYKNNFANAVVGGPIVSVPRDIWVTNVAKDTTIIEDCNIVKILDEGVNTKITCTGKDCHH